MLTWGPPEQFKNESQKHPTWCFFPPLFWCGARDNERVLPMKNTGLQAILLQSNNWSSSWTSRCGRHFHKTSATTLVMMSEMMGKTKQELMRPRELLWPSRLLPFKSSDHRSSALRWSLFIFNMELRKIGLEVEGLIYWISLICRDMKALDLLGIQCNSKIKLNYAKRVWVNSITPTFLVKHLMLTTPNTRNERLPICRSPNQVCKR